MGKWKQCRKKPIIVNFREVEAKEEFAFDVYKEKVVPCHSATTVTKYGERISTLESGWDDVLYALTDEDFIIRGVKGEIYPIKKSIFYETYDVLETPLEYYKRMKGEGNDKK